MAAYPDISDFTNSAGTGTASAADTAALPKPATSIYDRFKGYGARARALPVVGGLLKSLPGIGLLGQAAADEGTPLATTARAAIGATALFNPGARALATGMLAGDALVGAAGPSLLAASDAANDIRGPATKAFQNAGGNTTTYATPPMPYVAPPQPASAGSIADTSGYADVAAEGPGAVPRYQTTTAAGGMFSALARLKVIGNTQAGELAERKLALEGKLKGAEAAKHLTEAALGATRLGAAERARAAGSPESEVAAITAGRSQGPTYQGFPDITGKNIDVLQTRGTGAGAVVRKPSQPAVTRAEYNEMVAKVAKDKKLTPEAAAAEVTRNMRDNARVMAN